MILNNDNKLVDLISLSFVGLRVIVFEKINWIYRLYKNELIMEMTLIRDYMLYYIQGYIFIPLYFPKY